MSLNPGTPYVIYLGCTLLYGSFSCMVQCLGLRAEYLGCWPGGLEFRGLRIHPIVVTMKR